MKYKVYFYSIIPTRNRLDLLHELKKKRGLLPEFLAGSVSRAPGTFRLFSTCCCNTIRYRQRLIGWVENEKRWKGSGPYDQSPVNRHCCVRVRATVVARRSLRRSKHRLVARWKPVRLLQLTARLSAGVFLFRFDSFATSLSSRKTRSLTWTLPRTTLAVDPFSLFELPERYFERARLSSVRLTGSISWTC